MAGRSAIMLLLIALVSLAIGCRRDKMPPGYLLDGPGLVYFHENGATDRYEATAAGEIAAGGKTVFQAARGLGIRGFDLLRWQGELILGILLAGDGREYLAVYNADRQKHLAVKDMTAYRPWKLRLSDVDADGDLDVCVGVEKTSPLHDVMAKRLFIYYMDNDGLRPKWLGSRLAHPFTDFDFARKGAQTCLLALELTRDGRQTLNSYHWDGFGFVKTEEYPGKLRRPRFQRGYAEGAQERSLIVTDGGSVLKIISDAPISSMNKE